MDIKKAGGLMTRRPGLSPDTPVATDRYEGCVVSRAFEPRCS